MTVFRICLANGERRIKADLKASDEQSVRKNLGRWFDNNQWQILEIKRVQT
jgi:hypothetical protein